MFVQFFKLSKKHTKMKGLVFFVLIFFEVIAKANPLSVKLISHNTYFFKTFEKVEIGIELPFEVIKFIEEGKINPFNSTEIEIKGEVFYSDTLIQKLWGFYFEEMKRVDLSTTSGKIGADGWQKVLSDYIFRIRFAPMREGNFTAKILVVVPQFSIKEEIKFEFKVENGPSRGFVENTKSKKYLNYSSGESFFPIGLNLYEPKGWYLKDQNKDIDQLEIAVNSMDEYIRKLKNNGANFFALGLQQHNYGIEFEKVGDYRDRMGNAWEIDQLLNKCDSLDMYLCLTLFFHPDFDRVNWPGPYDRWNENGYSKIEGVNSRKDFFTNEKAKEFFKQRLRYISSRWGYSTKIAFYEIFTEINQGFLFDDFGESKGSWKTSREDVKKWVDEMSTYLKEFLGDVHLNSISGYACNFEIKEKEESIWTLKNIDIVQQHSYGSLVDDMEKRLSEYVIPASNEFQKPVYFDEIGAGLFSEKEAISPLVFHNNLWSQCMMGTMGSGLNYYWFEILEKGYDTNFIALSSFLKDVDWIKNDYEPQLDKSGMFEMKCNNDFESKIAAYTLLSSDKTNAMGWVHNRSYNYINTNGKVVFQSWMGKRDTCSACCAIPVEGTSFRIRKLLPNKKYKIEFYTTTSTLTLVETKEYKTGKLFRSIKVDVPKLDEINKDYSYKVMLLD